MSPAKLVSVMSPGYNSQGETFVKSSGRSRYEEGTIGQNAEINMEVPASYPPGTLNQHTLHKCPKVTSSGSPQTAPEAPPSATSYLQAAALRRTACRACGWNPWKPPVRSGAAAAAAAAAVAAAVIA